MKVIERGTGFQVVVHHPRLPKGRYRKQHPTEALARLDGERLERDLLAKYPAISSTVSNEAGTLRKAASLALENHWTGPYKASVKHIIWHMVGFFEQLGKRDLDDILTEDLEELVRWKRSEGNKASSINKWLSCLSVCFDMALQRNPPMATKKPVIKHVSKEAILKWWMTPEDFEGRVVPYLRHNGEDVFLDYLGVLIFTGVRPTEGLVTEVGNFKNLLTDKPLYTIPGTKTSGAQATLPVFPKALPYVLSAVQRAERMGWKKCFPITWRQANDKWQEVRDLMGATESRTATLRALRRSFAKYCQEMGIDAFTLKDLMRHSGINTTDGYLTLVGREAMMEKAREKANVKKPDGGLMAALSAYKATGATPEEVARFTKELLGWHQGMSTERCSLRRSPR